MRIITASRSGTRTTGRCCGSSSHSKARASRSVPTATRSRPLPRASWCSGIPRRGSRAGAPPPGLTGGTAVPVAYSPNGALLAVAATRQEIQLLDARTFDPLATLTPPLPLNLDAMRFSADSRHLAAQTQGPLVHLWDFHALRRELRATGLDW